jgi:hypothetical protein
MYPPISGYSMSPNVIFQVDPPFTFSDSVQPITLECDPELFGVTAVVTGWGATEVRHFVN